jgi:hypothetical protein
VFDAHSRRRPRPLLDTGMLRMIAPSALDASSLGATQGMRIEAPNTPLSPATSGDTAMT